MARIPSWPRPRAEFQSVKRDVQGNYLHAVREAYGGQLTGARREERVVGGGAANYFRRPFGPGWALVGDAGYLKDPVTAQGITDAFLDAELCAAALEAALAGRQPFDAAMGGYQRRRDTRVMPMYEFTAQLASMEPPPPELGQLLAGIAGRQQAMDKFAGLIAGTVSPAELFDPARTQAGPGSQA